MEFSNDVTVIGTGRVGLPLALSLLNKGLRINGIDRDKHIINSVNDGVMPFDEPGYQQILSRQGFSIDEDYTKVSQSAYLIITVGTPLRKNIETDLDAIKTVFDQLAPYIQKEQTIMLRSTVAPGTTEYISRYIEKKTGFKVGDGIFLAYCPERIAEGKALEELESLPQIVGCADSESAKRAEKIFKYLVDDIFHTSYITAELSKLFSNISRYVYFAVSNYFMILADEFGANIFEILNMTNYKYPRQIISNPGLTAGTCLRKDFGMINEHTAYMDLLLSSWKVNEYIPQFLVSHLLKRTQIHRKKVAVLGYTFKKDTDDPRDSLTPKLIRYIQREVPDEIRICEPNMPSALRLENGTRNLAMDRALEEVDIVFIAVNHSYFADQRRQMFELCRKDTWFVDVWNLCELGQIYFQKMEIYQ